MLDKPEDLFDIANNLISELNSLDDYDRFLVDYIKEQVEQNGYCTNEDFLEYKKVFSKDFGFPEDDY